MRLWKQGYLMRNMAVSDCLFGGQVCLHPRGVPGLSRLLSRNFDVIPVFPNKINPVEFLASAQFGELLEDARVAYDTVVIDTPPVMMAADGLIISRRVDSVLLAVRWGRTPRPVVANAIYAINQSEVRSLDAVLTMVNTKKYEGGRLGDSTYLYRKYSGYYNHVA